jgi:hypothetical protein
MITRQQARARTHRYPSLAAFYNASPGRLSSREIDIGLWWREREDGPLHRAAWVCDTGELYLAALGPRERGAGTVEVLARETSRTRLESGLAGWRERCGRGGSLQWLRERAAQLGERPRRRATPCTGGALAAR